MWLTGCLLLTAESTGRASPGTTREGYLVRRVEGMEDVTACPSERVAFVWAAKTPGLFLVGESGVVLNEKAPILASSSIVEVFVPRTVPGAWIVARDHVSDKTANLYFIDRCAVGAPAVPIADAKLDASMALRFRPFGGPTPRAWLTWSGGITGLLEGSTLKQLDGMRLGWMQALRAGVSGERLWALTSDNREIRLTGYDVVGRQSSERAPKQCFAEFFDEGDIVGVDNDAVWMWSVVTKYKPKYRQEIVVCLRTAERRIEHVVTLPEAGGLGLGRRGMVAIDARRAWLLDGHASKLHLLRWEAGKTTQAEIDADEILSADGKANHVWIRRSGRTFIAEARDDGTILERPTKIPAGTSAYRLYWSDAEGNAWFSDNRGLRRTGVGDAESMPFLSGQLLAHAAASPDRRGVWVRTLGDLGDREARVFVLRDASLEDAVKAKVQFADGALDTTQATAKVRCGPGTDHHADVTLAWPAMGDPKITGGRVELVLKSDTYERKEPFELVLRTGREMSLPDFPCKPGKYTARLTYFDDYGSQVTFTWPEVEIADSLWDNTYLRTLLAFGGLLLLAGVAAAIRVQQATLARWLPLLATTLAGAGEYAFLKNANVNFPALGSLVGLAMLAGLGAGALSPRVFRQLAPIAPYDKLLPLALGVPRLRRRLLKEYVARVRRVLGDQRRLASAETYVEIPVLRLPQAADEKPGPVTLVGIAAKLNAANVDERARVYIEAPAGRGKSALLRALVERLLLAFDDDPSRPLPVLCPKIGAELEKTVVEELGRDGFSDAVVKEQLRKGLLVVVADALDEGSWPAENLKRFVTGPHQDTRLLLASRPNAARRAALANADRWLHVEPAALDTATIETFEDAYKAADARASIPSRALDERMRKLRMVNRDGYSPLLVRFAMRSSGDQIRSVYGLYNQVLQSLLQQDDPEKATDFLTKAAALCKDTHWKTGQREITEAETPKHAGIVEILKRASILAPAGERGSLRFFHASALSFLTAYGLAPDADEVVLARAAGHRDFHQERSDLLEGPGSDLFFFLTGALAPKVLGDRLHNKLIAWVMTIGDDLARTLVAGAAPDAVKAGFEGWLAGDGADKSSRVILAEMLAHIAALDEDAKAGALVAVFTKIAPEAWTLEAKKPAPVAAAPG